MFKNKVLAPLLELRGTAAEVPALHREKIGRALHALADQQLLEAGAHGMCMMFGGINVPDNAQTVVQDELAMGRTLREVANEFLAQAPGSNPVTQRAELFASIASQRNDG